MRRKIVFILLSVCICFMAGAQDGHSSKNVWKRTVSRKIDIRNDQLTAPHSSTDIEGDSSLAETIIYLAKSGKLAAYKGWYSNVPSKLNLNEVNEIAWSYKIEDVSVMDTLTGKEKIVVRAEKFDFHSITKFRIIENWTFNPNTGKTEIQITGIAPMWDVYGEDGVYRGTGTMFLIQFRDLDQILTQYDQAHPQKPFWAQIWKDYFSGDINTNIPHQRAFRLIDMVEKEDTIRHILDNELVDTCLSLMSYCAIRAGQLSAYRDENFTTLADLSARALLDSMEIIFDVCPIVDLESGEPQPINEMQTAERYLCHLHNYKIMEEWNFNPLAGKTEIQITGIAPCYSIFDDKWVNRTYHPVFWTRYRDVREIITRYEQYHPTNIIAAHIWNNYFFSDVKPQIVK